MIGQVVQGGYKLTELLGKSPRGSVFRATAPSEGGPSAAVHVLHRAESDDPDAAEAAFRREALLRSQLRLPEVPGFLGAGRLPGGDPYFIVEFVPGPDLATYLRRHGPARAPELLEQALRGLAGLHGLGIRHNGIRPTNIFVSTAGYLKLSGLKPTMDAPCTGQTAQGALVAPETAGGVRDGRSDLYSLGAAFYIALTRLRPFSGATPSEILASQMKDRPLRPTGVDSRIPDEVERVVLRLLEADPAERYPTAEQALEDLTSLKPTSAGELPLLVPTFVGREAERLRVQALLRGASEGLGAAILVLAATGGGRSRFVQEVVHRCQARSIPAAVGRCLGPPPLPLGAVRELVVQAAAQGWLKNPERLAETLTAARAAQADDRAWGWSDPGDQLTNARLHIFEELLTGLTGEPEGGGAVSPGLPAVLLVLEDLHRADSATLEFFRFAARSIRGRRAVLLGTCRAEPGDQSGQAFVEALASELPIEAMHMAPLADGEVGRLVTEVAGVGELTEDWLPILIRLTEGNPRFASLAAYLALRGLIRPNEFSIRSVLAQVLELAEGPRAELHQVLRESPLGCPQALLAAISGLDSGQAAVRIERLLSLGLIEVCGHRVRLAHDGDQALGGAVAESREGISRALLEAAVAERGRDPQVAASLLAFLADRAGAREESAFHHLAAGDEAWALGSSQEALTSFEQAEALLSGPAGLLEGAARARGQAMRRRVEILWQTGRLPAARTAAEDLLAAESSGLVTIPRSEILELQARLSLAEGDHGRAVELLRQAVMCLGGSEDELRRVHLLRALARTHLAAGATERAGETCVEALVICKRLDLNREVGWTLSLLGEIRTRVGDRDRARHCFEESIRLLEEEGDRYAVATANAALGKLHFEAGEVGKAIARHLVAYREYQRLGWESRADDSAESVGNDYLLAGRDREALRYLRIAMEARERIGVDPGPLLARVGKLAHAVGDHAAAIQALSRVLRGGPAPEARPHLLVLLGAAHARRASFDRAVKFLQDGLEAANQIGDPASKIGALLRLAEVHAEIGDAERGLRFQNTADTLGEGIQDRLLQVDLALSSAHTRLMAVQAQALASAALDELLITAEHGIAVARETGTDSEKYRALRILAEILVESGDLARALTHVTSVLPWARRSGNRYLEAECLLILGEICFRNDRIGAGKAAAAAGPTATGAAAAGAAGEGAKALRCALEALEILEEHRRPELEWKVRVLAGRAQLLRGDAAGAKRSLTMGLRIIRAVSEAITDENLRRAYLRHPRRREAYKLYKGI